MDCHTSDDYKLSTQISHYNHCKGSSKQKESFKNYIVKTKVGLSPSIKIRFICSSKFFLFQRESSFCSQDI